MTNRIDGATAVFARKMATQPIVWTCMATKAAKRLLTTAQHTLTVTGLTAVALGALLYARPELAQKAANLVHPQATALAVTVPSPADLMAVPVAQASASSDAASAPAADAAGKHIAPLNSKQQKWVTEWLAKRYRVASDATDMLVSTAYLTAREVNIDPLLILAVMAIESGFNPFAESPMGARA
jgi:soluble lytic murein transglycosylase-like protein